MPSKNSSVVHGDTLLHVLESHDTTLFQECDISQCIFIHHTFEIHIYDQALKYKNNPGLTGINIYSHNTTCDDALNDERSIVNEIQYSDELFGNQRSYVFDVIMQYMINHNYATVKKLLTLAKVPIYDISVTKAPTIVDTISEYAAFINYTGIYSVYIDIAHDCHQLCAQTYTTTNYYSDNMLHVAMRSVSCAKKMREGIVDTSVSYTPQYTYSVTADTTADTTAGICASAITHTQRSYQSYAYIALAAIVPVFLFSAFALFVVRSSSATAQRIREYIIRVLSSTKGMQKIQTYDHIYEL